METLSKREKNADILTVRESSNPLYIGASFVAGLIIPSSMHAMTILILKFRQLLLLLFCNCNLLLIIITNPVAVAVASTTSIENLAFILTNFDHDVTYEGSAYSSNGVIQLTTNQLGDMPLNGSVGRATYKDPMHLWESRSGNLADFNTQFSFSIWSERRNMHDSSFAFLLAPNGSRLPAYSEGCSFGLLAPNQSASKFVAFEFHTCNGWELSGNQTGTDMNNITSPDATSWGWNDLEDGAKVQAQISYKSSSHELNVLLFGKLDSNGFYEHSSLSYTIDLREYLPEWVTVGFYGSTRSISEIQSIYSWNFSSRLQVQVNITNPASSRIIPLGPPPGNSKNGINMKWMGIIFGTVFLISLILGCAWFWFSIKRTGRRRSEIRDQEEDLEMETGPRKLSYKDLLAATNKFSDDNVLGQGGFGKVYKGFLKDRRCEVAVKRITPNNSQQGSKEFASEVKTISKLGHMNLLELIGWCCEKQEYLIVYKFMPNKSLDFHLFEQNNLLTWENRYKIAMGLASALHYLQEEQDPYILHRDIKSSNVLLDAEFNAKLGDFGLAKLVDPGQKSKTTILRGTKGYVAPEYQESSIASKESDIYSFGVVCLEIACGKQAVGEIKENGKKFVIKLVEWVWDHYRRENVLEAADPKLCRNFKKEEMQQLMVIGLACAQPDFSLRPSIKQVIDILNFKAPLPNLPSEYPGRSNSAMFASAYMDLIRSSSCPASVCQRGQAQFSGNSHLSRGSSSSTSSDLL